MTYQLTLVGSDGIVMASDQNEWRKAEGGSRKNRLKKIAIHRGGKFAWMFAGLKVAKDASRLFERWADNAAADPSQAEVLEEVRRCGQEAWKTVTGPCPNTDIVIAFGASKRIYRAELSALMLVEQMESPLVSGQNESPATLIPSRFYSQTMPVDKLAVLAAYTIGCAEQFDSLAVNGLDMVAYRDSTAKFEVLENGPYTERAAKLNSKIATLFIDA